MSRGKVVQLRPYAQAMLADCAKSGLNLEQVRALQFKPLPAEEVYKLTNGIWRDPAYKIPYFRLNGTADPFFYRLRRLPPPETNSGGSFKAKEPKPALNDFRYWQPRDYIPSIYLPPIISQQSWPRLAQDPTIPLYITEGEKKAAKACSLDLPCIGLGGVWNFKSNRAGVPFLRELEAIKWTGRQVMIVFDADVAGRSTLQGALHALAQILTQYGAQVYRLDLPPSLDFKVGLDDYLHRDGLDAFKALSPKPFTFNEVLWDLNNRYAVIKNSFALFSLEEDRLINEREFRLAEADKQLLIFDAGGRPHQLAATVEWLKWTQRTTFTKLVYEPQPLGSARELTDGSYNLWRGWGLDSLVKQSSLQLFHQLLDHLFSNTPDPGARSWFEQWLAYPLQHPGTKLLSAVVIHGLPGSGKNLLGYTLRQLYGYANCSEIKQAHLHAQFNSWLAYKQFIIADEVIGSDKRAEQNTIKALITQETVIVNEKHQPPYTLTDRANYLFLSNNEIPVYITEDDRRFFVISINRLPPVYFVQKYDQWYRTATAKAAIFNYLLHVSLKGFKPNAAPPTTLAKRAVVESGQSDLESFILDEVIAGYDRCFALGNEPTKGDLQTAETVAKQHELLHSTNRTTSPIATGHILSRLAALGRCVKLNPLRLEDGGRFYRFYAFRNLAKWRKAAPEQIRAHYLAVTVQPARPKQFKQ